MTSGLSGPCLNKSRLEPASNTNPRRSSSCGAGRLYGTHPTTTSRSATSDGISPRPHLDPRIRLSPRSPNAHVGYPERQVWCWPVGRQGTPDADTPGRGAPRWVALDRNLSPPRVLGVFARDSFRRFGANWCHTPPSGSSRPAGLRLAARRENACCGYRWTMRTPFAFLVFG